MVSPKFKVTHTFLSDEPYPTYGYEKRGKGNKQCNGYRYRLHFLYAQEDHVATTVLFGELDDLLDIRKDNIFKAVFTRTQQFQDGPFKACIGHCRQEHGGAGHNGNEPAPDDERSRQLRFDINCKIRV